MDHPTNTGPIYLVNPAKKPPEMTRKIIPMKCPIDNEILAITTRDGVEIDYCPKCRGVWLDRGELDKIIERSMPAPIAKDQYADRRNNRDNYEENDGHSRKSKRSGKKYGSILGDLFDF
jgi:uncharacterized protein